MARWFPKIRMIYAMPGFGIACWAGLFINKKRMENRLDSEIVQRVLQFMREDKELMTVLGGDFKIKTNMLSLARSGYNFKGPYGESRFILTSPTGIHHVTFNGSSQPYEAILASNRPTVNKAKFTIPEEAVVKQIRATENPETLKDVSLDPRSRFWCIDFVSLAKGDKTLIRKPSSVLNLEVQRPNYRTLFDVFQDLRATDKARKNPPSMDLQGVDSSRIVNFRMRNILEQRTSMVLSTVYLGSMIGIIVLAQRRRWTNTTLADHIFFIRAKQLLQKTFPGERHLICNTTSLDGLYLNKARFQVQFSGQEVGGTGFFALEKQSDNDWLWKEARVEYRTADVVHLQRKIDLSHLKESVKWVDQDPSLLEDKEEEAAPDTPPIPTKAT